MHRETNGSLRLQANKKATRRWLSQTLAGWLTWHLRGAEALRLLDLLGSGQQAFALQLLAGQLAGAADGLGLLAGLLLRWLFKVAAQLHLAENALALHLFLQNFKGLVDIVVTDYDLQVLPQTCSSCVGLKKSAPAGGSQSWRGDYHSLSSLSRGYAFIWPILRPRRASPLP